MLPLTNKGYVLGWLRSFFLTFTQRETRIRPPPEMVLIKIYANGKDNDGFDADGCRTPVVTCERWIKVYDDDDDDDDFFKH